MNRPALLLIGAIAITAFIAALAGCSINAAVVDHINEQMSVSGVRLASGGSLKVSQGGAIRLVPLSRIRTITMHQYESMTLNRELYYLADIEMKDGTILAAERQGWNVTFVCIGDVLKGKANKASISLPLDKVSKITFK